MGGEAALAYQISSGLIGAGGAYANANSRASSASFMDRTGVDASLASYRSGLDLQYSTVSKQADLILQELATESQRQADESEYEQQSTAQHFNSSGVMLAGTPLEVMKKQRELKIQEIDALERRATALAGLTRAKGTIDLNEGNARIAAAESDYITKDAQFGMGNESTKSASQSYAGSDFVSLLGSTFSYLSGTKYGQKFTSKFNFKKQPGGMSTFSPARSLYNPSSLPFDPASFGNIDPNY